MQEGVRLKKGSTVAQAEPVAKVTDHLIEPSAEEVRQTLVPQLIRIMVYHALMESKASEHSARMVAMKNASDNAAELVDELRLIYNKTRQQSITSELLDIVSATMALN